MKLQNLTFQFLTSLILLATPWIMRPAVAQPTNIFCGRVNGTPATMASVPGSTTPIILWSAENYFAESGEDTLTRCTRVSGLLEHSRQRGQGMITTGIARNGKPMICIANPQDGSCSLLYQVPNGQSPQQLRQQLLQRLNNPNLPPIRVN